MADALFNNLYTRFLLRDIFGKIAPGAVVLLGFAVASTGDPLEHVARRYMPPGLSAITILHVALAWILGFAAQFLVQALEALVCRRTDGPLRRIHWPTVVAERALIESPTARMELERVAIIKEATGNMCVAIAWLGLGSWVGAGLPVHDRLFGGSLCVALLGQFFNHRVREEGLQRRLLESSFPADTEHG